MIDFQEIVVAGTILIRDAIQSPNYVAGVSGWTVNKDGSAEFNSVTIRGNLTATSASGAYVSILADASAAQITIEPANVVSHTFTPAVIYASSGTTSVGMSVIGPNMDGNNETYGVFFNDTPTAGSSAIRVSAKTINLEAATALQVNGVQIGLGYVTGVEDAVSLNGITTTETLALTTPTVTFAANRAFEITAQSLYSFSLATASNPGANFRKTNAAGLVLSDIGRWNVTPGGSTIGYVNRCIFITGGSAVSAAIAMTLFAGSGTMNHVSTSGSPRRFDITDIGPASRYPNQKVLS